MLNRVTKKFRSDKKPPTDQLKEKIIAVGGREIKKNIAKQYVKT